MKNLPVIPDVALKIVGMAEDGMDLSFGGLEDIIKMDPILSAKILKVANSAMYARQKEITNLKMAISLIGFKTIKSLVLLISASNFFPKYQKFRFYSYFWRHSLYTAFAAKKIVLQGSAKDKADQTFLTGLFHDIGQIALFNTDPGAYEELVTRRETEHVRMRALERERFGLTHTEVGAEVLTRWNFPALFIDVARYHGGEVVTSPYQLLIAAVSAADILSNEFEGFPLPPEKEETLLLLARKAEFSEDKLRSLRESFVQGLDDDPLYGECKAMFRIS